MSKDSQLTPKPDDLQTLIEAVIDGLASSEQHQQLESRLLADPKAQDRYLSYVNLHASLCRVFLARESAESLDADIVDFALLASEERIAETTKRSSWLNWAGWLVAICLLVAVGIPLARNFFAEATQTGPTVVSVTGQVLLKVGNETTQLAAGQVVLLGQTLATASEESQVSLRYADGTEIALLGSSQLTVNSSSAGGKQLQLLTGMLRADVTPQAAGLPFLISTPQATVRVLGTAFELAADAEDGTRLDLESGEVELARDGEASVQVQPNSIAIVPATADPIRVLPRPLVVDTPLRETVFNGLKSIAFAKDGKTLVCGTRWQALYWYENDRLEAIPLSESGRHGISLRNQAGSLLTYFDHQQEKLIAWDAESRQPIGSFGEITDLKRQFRNGDSRPEGWNPATSVAALSPNYDWIAFKVAREFRVWQTEEQRWLKFAKRYDGKFTSAIASSPNGKLLAVAIRRGELDIVDVSQGEVIESWSLAHQVPHAMSFSADGKHLVLGRTGHVAVYDLQNGELLAEFEQPGLPFLKVAISADGRFVAAASPSERVWVWDRHLHAEVALLEAGGQVLDLAFEPVTPEVGTAENSLLAVATRKGRLTLWRLPNDKPHKESAK